MLFCYNEIVRLVGLTYLLGKGAVFGIYFKLAVLPSAPRPLVIANGKKDEGVVQL